MGRFLSADPYRASNGGPGDPLDPQSWNRYIYAEGDPVDHYDPFGTTTCDANGKNCRDSVDVTASGGTVPTGDSSFMGGAGAPRRNPPVPADSLGMTASQAWALAKGYQLAVKQGRQTDCQALAGFAQDAADQNMSVNQFVNNLGVLTPRPGSSVAGIAWNTNPVALNTGQSSGYQAPYQNTLPDNPTTGWNGDQGHRFSAFCAFGYKYGAGASSVVAFAMEWWQGTDSGVLNAGDVALGEAAAKIGADLKSGKISTSDVSSVILHTICAH